MTVYHFMPKDYTSTVKSEHISSLVLPINLDFH